MTPSSMHACTIIDRNYLPYARVLAESHLKHHPEGRFTALILDGHEDLHEPFDLVGPYDIGIERRELHQMAMIYDVKELATAVKPWFLRKLLDEGPDGAVYFDPDIVVYAPLDDIGTLAYEHGVVLTPHTMVPPPDDDRLPDYKMIMQAGIYNLGFIAVSRRADEFLDWWSAKLARHCLNSVEQGIFVDQRWVDFAPALFDHYVVRDAACNVAYWNLHGRELKWTGDGYEVDGSPLRFFHFSGFKPDTPNILSHHMGTRPRILPSQHPDVARICREYSRQLFARGYGSMDTVPYAFDRLKGGIEIDQPMRRLFREALLAAELDGCVRPPEPFNPAEASAFLEWFRKASSSPRTFASRRRAVTARAMVRVEKRLRALAYRYPQLARAKPVWRGLKRARVGGEPRIALPPPPTLKAPTPAAGIDIAAVPSEGVNLVGYLPAELGIGEVARKIMSGLERAGIDFSTVAYGRTLSRQRHGYNARRPQRAPYDTNIICVNADQLPIFYEDAGRAFFTNRYSIGVWFWEISRFPSVFHRAFEFVDEVWVATSFVRDAVAATTTKRVEIIPLPLEVPPPQPMSRVQLGLPEGFVFLFSFDFLSVFERKNPLGLIDGFTRAYADGEGPTLVLKSINGEHDPASLERLRTAAASRSDIRVIDGYLSPDEKNALMASCDCYVSLHRSEGLGLTMAEAMAYGKPVIATGYSGNVDFMNEGNSYLVPYTLGTIPRGCDPYPAGAEWAAPDLDAAAAAMRRVYDAQDEARTLGAQAREDVLTRFSVDRTAEFLNDRGATRQAARQASGAAGEPAGGAPPPLDTASSKLELGPAP